MTEKMQMLEERVSQVLQKLDSLKQENGTLKMENKSLKEDLNRLRQEFDRFQVHHNDQAEAVKSKLVLLISRIEELLRGSPDTINP